MITRVLGAIVLLFCCLPSFAQKKIVLNGKIVKEELESPIESATIYLFQSKDSSVVDYTISDKNGLFVLKTQAADEKMIFKVSGENCQDFSRTFEKLTADTDLGILKLKGLENMLNEVVIKGVAPPVRIKKDTLEFNASSFKMRPDANVEALLKQLPGVEIDADKKITVNGKEVNQILVNGKPFFGEDGKVALQNLPSEIINKVQVSDTKTKEEEYTKQASTSDKASINLTIEKEKNKGFFGKVLGGYGSSDRYESSMLMSYFRDKRRISFLASSNNINATGFSMDEVFDNMGGGRSSRGRGNQSTGGTGITKSSIIGVNYTDELFKGFNPNANYEFTNSDFENNNKTTEITLLPTGSLLSESNSNTNRGLSRHKADLHLEYEITPDMKILFSPRLEKGMTDSFTHFDKVTKDENDNEINTSESNNKDETDNTNFSNQIRFFKKSKKDGRYVSASFSNQNSRFDSNSIVNSSTFFKTGTNPDDIRIQNVKADNHRDEYQTEISYAEPITDSLGLHFSVFSFWEKTADDTKTFDGKEGNVDFNDFNDLLSNYILFKKLEIAPKTGFRIRKKKFHFYLSVGTYFINTDSHSFYRSTATDLNKKYVIPEGTISGSYNLSNSKRFHLFYDRRFEIPRGHQVLDVENLANPLNTLVGNPDLKVSTSHFFNLSFSDYDYQSRSGYYFYSGTTYFDNQIVSTSVYDEAGKQTTTYTNVYSTYNTNLGGNWNKSIKQDAHTFGFNLGLNGSYSLNKGFTNGQLYSAKTQSLSPNLRFTYDYGELFSIKPSYNFSLNNTEYTNSSFNSRSNTSHNFNVEMTSFWPKNLVFGNDFGYSYNTNISRGYRKDFYLWNTSLSYKFAEDKMTFKVKVYDLLNQNQSTSRFISPTSVTDSENTVLKRYVMFTLLYKFQDFAGMKK